MNIQKKIFEHTNPDKKNDFFEIFKEASRFIKQNISVENQLIVGLIYKQNELKSLLKNNETNNSNDEFINNFNDFVKRIIFNIQEIENII